MEQSKQKKIEEIVRFIDIHNEAKKIANLMPSDIVGYDGKPKSQHLYIEQKMEIAKEIIKQGAVVLTREEYEKLQALKDDYSKGYEAGVDEGWDNARKETAEKFAGLVEFHSVATVDEEGVEQFTISALALKEILREDFGFTNDEICKEIVGGGRWDMKNIAQSV